MSSDAFSALASCHSLPALASAEERGSFGARRSAAISWSSRMPATSGLSAGQAVKPDRHAVCSRNRPAPVTRWLADRIYGDGRRKHRRLCDVSAGWRTGAPDVSPGNRCGPWLEPGRPPWSLRPPGPRAGTQRQRTRAVDDSARYHRSRRAPRPACPSGCRCRGRSPARIRPMAVASLTRTSRSRWPPSGRRSKAASGGTTAAAARIPFA